MHISNVRKIIKLYDRMLETVCRSYQLSKTEVSIINFLQHNPEKDTAADITEMRMLAKSQVSASVESLIQKGLLQRQPDRIDRRRIHLSLLPTVLPITQDIHKVQCRFREVILDGFTENECKLYEAFHDRLLENVVAALDGKDSV